MNERLSPVNDKCSPETESAPPPQGTSNEIWTPPLSFYDQGGSGVGKGVRALVCRLLRGRKH